MIKVKDKTNDETIDVIDVKSAEEASIEDCKIAIDLFEGAIEHYKNDPKMLNTVQQLIKPWKKRFEELCN